MISYEPFGELLRQRGIRKVDLMRKYQLSSSLVYRMSHNYNLSTHTINVLCSLFDCRVEDIMIYHRDNSSWLVENNRAKLLSETKKKWGGKK